MNEEPEVTWTKSRYFEGDSPPRPTPRQQENLRLWQENYRRRYAPTGDPVRDRARANDYFWEQEMAGLGREVWGLIIGVPFTIILMAPLWIPAAIAEFVFGANSVAAFFAGSALVIGFFVYLWSISAKPWVVWWYDYKYGPGNWGRGL